MKKLSLLLASMLFSAHAYATSSADLAPEIYGNGTTAPTTTAPTTNTTGSTPFPKYVPPPPPAPAPAASPAQNASINPSANQGQQSQSSGAGANAAAGAALMAAGMALMSQPPTVPAGAALIAMGMLALAQSGHDSGAANQSAATGAASVYGNSTNNTGATAPTNPALGKGTSAFNTPAVKDAQAALSSAGYAVTPSGLMTPDGTTIPNSAFNSPGGMAAAGMSPDQVKAVQDALGKVNGGIGGDGGKVSAVALSEGGGGGPSADKPETKDFSFSAKTSAFGLSDAAKKAMIAGKTVNFDGDPIGVRGNNIFDMIHVAYEKKRGTHDFIDSDSGVEPGPALRMPASSGLPTVAPPAKTGAPSRARITNR